MKQILVLFFTFLEICTARSQTPVPGSAADSSQQSIPAKTATTSDSVLRKKIISANIYPNPAKNKVEIAVKGFEPGFIRLQMTDIKGNLMRDDKRQLIFGEEVIILMFSLSPGIYFISLRQEGKMVRKRLLVQ